MRRSSCRIGLISSVRRSSTAGLRGGPEIGWTIWSTEAEGKGIAAEAARAAIDFAFRDLGWPTAVSYIAPGNERSIALAKRLGAVQDTTAPRPGDGSALVFRHPKPEALA